MPGDPANANPEAIRFCNSRIRPAADLLAELYYTAKSVSQEWTANELGTIIPYNSDGPIVDGSDTDGRHPIDGIAVNNLLNRLTEFVADLEADNNAKLNTVLAVAVKTGT